MKLRVTAVHPTTREDNSSFTIASWHLEYLKAGQGAYTTGPTLPASQTVADIAGVNVGETWTVKVCWLDSDGQLAVKVLSADPVAPPAPPPLPALPRAGNATMVTVEDNA